MNEFLGERIFVKIYVGCASGLWKKFRFKSCQTGMKSNLKVALKTDDSTVCFLDYLIQLNSKRKLDKAFFRLVVFPTDTVSLRVPEKRVDHPHS